MSLYKQSELFSFLNRIGRKPNKRLSQNFLVDGNILNKIVDSADVYPGDTVIEVGPGPGVLTEALLEREAHVIAVEKDPLYAEELMRLDSNNLLTVIESDFLEVDIPKLLKGKKAKIVANLPYHLTAPIMGKILPLYELIDVIVVMIQKEVAIRMNATPGSKDFGSFSIFTQFYSEIEYLFPVSPHCFFPKPKVTSAVVRCTPKKGDQLKNPDQFFRFIKSIFSKRRKMLVTILKDSIQKDQMIEKLASLGISEKARPEDLEIRDFISIYQTFEHLIN